MSGNLEALSAGEEGDTYVVIKKKVEEQEQEQEQEQEPEKEQAEGEASEA